MESGVFGSFSGPVSRNFQISRNFPKWSDMASKVVRYGLESGPIWPPKWAVMISWTTISDHFGSHIKPLWKILKNHLALAHEPFSCVRSHCRSDFHYNYAVLWKCKGPMGSIKPIISRDKVA